MRVRAASAIALVLSCFASVASAESVARKWRLSVDFGGFSPQSEIPSDAANTLTIFDENLEFAWDIDDPRDDATIFGTLGIQPGPVGNLAVQYALGEQFFLEGSIGYGRTDVGDVEVQARFSQSPTNADLGLGFTAVRIPVGRMSFVPIGLSAVARFRPHAPFHPFVAGGIGYLRVDLETSSGFERLSSNLDSSLGTQAVLVGARDGRSDLFVPILPPAQDLLGATVDAPDSLTWHAEFGAEYSFGQRWALVARFRYEGSAEEVTIGFNGGEDLGVAVPVLTDFEGSDAANRDDGPMWIPTGGLVDGGRLVPRMGQPESTDCQMHPQFCLFDTSQRDGVADPGFYYVNGGRFDYASFSFRVGVRYTFR